VEILTHILIIISKLNSPEWW